MDIKQILKRVILYTSIILVLMSFGFLFIPELAVGSFIKLTLALPYSKSLLTSNALICDEIQLKIQRQNQSQNEKLAADILPLLENWPLQFEKQYYSNRIINTTSDLLKAFDIGRDGGLSQAKVCLFTAIKNISVLTPEWHSVLTKFALKLKLDGDTTIGTAIHAILANVSPPNLDIVTQEIL